MLAPRFRPSVSPKSRVLDLNRHHPYRLRCSHTDKPLLVNSKLDSRLGTRSKQSHYLARCTSRGTRYAYAACRCSSHTFYSDTSAVSSRSNTQSSVGWLHTPHETTSRNRVTLSTARCVKLDGHEFWHLPARSI